MSLRADVGGAAIPDIQSGSVSWGLPRLAMTILL
jgi:hypothetical protein